MKDCYTVLKETAEAVDVPVYPAAAAVNGLRSLCEGV